MMGEALEFAGRLIYGSAENAALNELLRCREIIARQIIAEFPDQEIPLEGDCGYVIEYKGTRRRFQVYPDYDPSLITSDHGSKKQREKQRQWDRMSNLCTAYVNADTAIDTYQELVARSPDLADGVEMLAASCLNLSKQFTRTSERALHDGVVSARQRGNRKGKGDLTAEQWQDVVARVDELSDKHGNRSQAATLVHTELLQGKFGNLATVPGVDAIRKKKKRLE